MNKYTMLQKLIADDINVPEMIFLDEMEFNYYERNKHLSESAYSMIECLLMKILDANNLPLVSIRCESKSNVLVEKRAPITMVNVGIMYLKSISSSITYYDLDTLYECYLDRAKYYGLDVEVREYNNVLEEIVYAVMCVYDKMRSNNYSGDKGIIIQRIVMGIFDEKSGTGICCNYPGPITSESYCKGVFIPRVVGIPLIKGCWGIGEMDLDEFRNINPKAYETIINIFVFLEKKYGPNPYIEFTCEGEKVFILQYEVRQRLVQKTST